MTPQTGACGEVEDLSFTEAGEKESGKEGESLFCGIRAELPRASSPSLPHSMMRRCSADHSSEGGRGHSPSWTQDTFTVKSTEH